MEIRSRGNSGDDGNGLTRLRLASWQHLGSSWMARAGSSTLQDDHVLPTSGDAPEGKNKLLEDGIDLGFTTA